MSKKDLIILLPNEHLRQRSQRVSILDDAVRKIIKDMKAAALDWEAGRPHEVGVALAAVQIDRPYRIIIVRNSFEDKNDKTFNVLINPEVVKLEGEVVEDFEGCLSVPDIYGKVGRSSRVRVRAIDENGQPIRLRAEGFLARVLQHEIDHISGRMFIDYIKDKPDAFFKLTPGGKLEGLPYETIQKSNIFRD